MNSHFVCIKYEPTVNYNNKSLGIGISNGQVSLPLLVGISKFSSSRTGGFSLVQSHYSEALDFYCVMLKEEIAKWLALPTVVRSCYIIAVFCSITAKMQSLSPKFLKKSGWGEGFSVRRTLRR